jgi:hypothetical protein
VAKLAARAVMTAVHATVDRDHAAHTGPQRQPDHRRCATASPESKLREAERPSVIDQRRRDTQRLLDRTGDRVPVPGSRDVDEEPCRAGRGVVQPRDPDPDAADARRATDRLDADLREPRDDAIGPLGCGCRDLVAVDDPPSPSVVLEHDDLDVRAAQVQPEVSARGPAVGAAHQVSPVTLV